MRRLLLASALCGLSLGPEALAVTVGVVIDGPTSRPATTLSLVRQETQALLGGEFDVRFPDDKRVIADWTLPGVRVALDRLMRDTEVDIVIALGLMASHEAARLERPSKPVVAAVVPDAELQAFPQRAGTSGRRNFTYIASFRGIDEELRAFHEIVRFDRLTIVADRVSLDAVPEFRDKARQLARDLGADIHVLSAEAGAAQILAELPPDTEAVYVTPLWRLSSAELRQLADGLAGRGLPSLSLLGRSEVEAGLLMSIGGLPADDTRFARRVALILQRLLLGEQAADIEVGFRLGRRLLINMRTARQIGFLPRWAVLIDAEKLYEDESAQQQSLTLTDTMLAALEANLTLQAAQFDVDIAADDVRNAAAGRLPQLDFAARHTRIDADRANPLVQAENSLDAEVGGSQLIYSEQAWSAVRIARHLEGATDQEYRAVILDTLQQSSSAYLSLLRAIALEAVRRSNLEVTRANLELARVRESIGASGRADVLRWESQIARDRQELLAAQAVRFQAEVALSQVLNRPQGAAVQPVRAGLDEVLELLDDPRFDSFIGNPVVWETFIAFSVTEALANAPELAGFEATLLAQERAVLAARRAWYVPDVALAASAGNNLNSSGAGSDRTGLMLDDESWSISLQASLPVFSGGALKARLSRSRHELAQLQKRYAALAESVEARMRAALLQVGGSYPAIELSADAARAAASNLELVGDAYSSGAVSVTDLIDAQDAALSADLAAAEAEYAFLIDYMEILRARGNFDLLLDPATTDAWYRDIEAFFRERGVEPLAR